MHVSKLAIAFEILAADLKIATAIERDNGSWWEIAILVGSL